MLVNRIMETGTPCLCSVHALGGCLQAEPELVVQRIRRQRCSFRSSSSAARGAWQGLACKPLGLSAAPDKPARRTGMPARKVEVRFSGLTVRAPINVGSSGLPTITNTYKNTLMVSCVRALCAAARACNDTNAVSRTVWPLCTCARSGG